VAAVADAALKGLGMQELAGKIAVVTGAASGIGLALVNTASMAGLLAPPFASPYTAAKHAIVALSESLYHELAMIGAPVGVSVLCPGMVRTRIVAGTG
jgi:NAD(P)-dependent dehydrogenase (short-subunit alcohol dehydrogenase family)